MISPSFTLVILLAFFISTIIFSFLINGLLLKFSSNMGLRNLPEGMIRWTNLQKPSLGGISFFIIYLISVVVGLFITKNEELLTGAKFFGQLATISIAFILGLSDDAYDTKPLLKLIVQISCGLILLFTGTQIELFESNFLNSVLTVLWIVGLMNSINMLDNMDGITTVVSIGVFVACLFVLFLQFSSNNIYLTISLGMIGGLLGFLFYNWNPSKIFMGDTGSQLLGSLTAIVGIEFLWNNPGIFIDHVPSRHIILVLLVFILPITDTTTVVINRILRKQSPFVGGKDHTTHNLSYIGLSDSQVAFVFLFISLLSPLIMLVIMIYIQQWKTLYTFLFGFYILLIFLSLYGLTVYNKNKRNHERKNK